MIYSKSLNQPPLHLMTEASPKHPLIPPHRLELPARLPSSVFESKGIVTMALILFAVFFVGSLFALLLASSEPKYSSPAGRMLRLIMILMLVSGVGATLLGTVVV